MSLDPTFHYLGKCIQLACKSVSTSWKSQELAKTDKSLAAFDMRPKKGQKSYNLLGYVGETEVMMTLLDVIKELSVSLPVRRRRESRRACYNFSRVDQ